MPTFTAIAFDRLLEPRDSKSADMPVPNSKPILRSKSIPHPRPQTKLERRNSSGVTERKVTRPQMTPALYTTPETTPLPDSPSSFPPSPYIVNHKRRGPRLSKSFSERNVASCQNVTDESKVNGNASDSAETNSANSSKDVPVAFTIPEPIEEEKENDVCSSPIAKARVNGFHDGPVEVEHVNGFYNGDVGGSNEKCESSNRGVRSSNESNGLAGKNDVLKLVALKPGRDSQCDDFFDPQELMSCASNTDGEEITGAESSVKISTPTGGEFYDAWEELSSESGQRSSPSHIEAELRGIRLSLLMEIEKRKQAEESLNDMRSQWQRIRQQLALVGITLPADPTVISEGQQSDVDPADELCQQIYLARFVSQSIGRGIAKAEVEADMEAKIESKNFEIARLLDRLRYYEAMNREMSQRNQEAVEMARRDRQRRKRKQRWVWGSIAVAITLGSAALAWSYLPPTGKGSTSTCSGPQAADHDNAAKQ